MVSSIELLYLVCIIMNLLCMHCISIKDCVFNCKIFIRPDRVSCQFSSSFRNFLFMMVSKES